MPDPIFANPRLASVYDAFDGGREDLSAYLAIADEWAARRVLDVGCGTGCLALLLAQSGRTVVGIDPAEASLVVARSKVHADSVTWICGDAANVPALAFDLATMTGNVAQVFLTDEGWLRALRGIRAGLRSRGLLVFETRRPEYRAWEEWVADTGLVVRDVPGAGVVERRFEVTDVSLPLVSFRYSYTFRVDGKILRSDSTLRFRSRDEVESSLTACGFRVLGVRAAPDRPGRESVFLAQRA